MTIPASYSEAIAQFYALDNWYRATIKQNPNHPALDDALVTHNSLLNLAIKYLSGGKNAI